MTDGSMTPAPCLLVARPNPLRSDTVFAQVPAGQTLAQMLGDGVSQTCRVTIEGVVVPCELWAKVRPKAGKTIHVTLYPQGGNGGKYARLVLMVVLIIAAPYLAPLLAPAGASAAVLSAYGAGIMIVGSLAITALIPPPTPKGLGAGGGDPFQQLASLTGTSNQASPYGVVPCVVGTKRFFPPHAALPYTEISGDDQYLRMLLDLGPETTPGSLVVSDIEIGGTDIASYDDVEWEISTAPTLFCQDIYELAVGIPLIEVNDTATRTTQAATTEISLDIVFAQGLYGIDAKNGTVTGSTEYQVEYRAVGSGTWLNASAATGVTGTGGFTWSPYSTFAIKSNKRKTLRAGIRWTVSSGQYEVRVTRGTSNWTGSTPGGGVGDSAWTVLRSVNPQLPSTTGTLKLAVRIKATDQLQGVVQNLSVLASQKVRQWDVATQTFTAPTVTTRPAWIYLWLMTQCPAVARRFADDRMFLDDVADWAAECEAKDYSIGFAMDSGRAFGDIVRDVLAAGRASFGLRNSLYSAVRDIEQTVPVQMFTPRNSWNFSFTRSFAELPHALRVKFSNPEASDQQDVRLVYWDGYDETNATRFEELDLSMVTNPDAAWRLGRYHLAVIWNRLNQYTFSADIENLVCERGDLIHVAHDIIGWGVAWGRVRSVDGSRIVLDEVVDYDSSKTYVLRVRKPDGSQVTSEPTGTLTWDNTYITFDMDISWDETDGPTKVFTMNPPLAVEAGDLYVIGEEMRDVAQLIVRKIEPGDDLTATITAVDAAPAVWTADAGTPPPFVSEITGKAWCSAPATPNVTLYAGTSAPDGAGVIKAVTGVSSAPQGGIFRFHVGGGGCPVVETPVRRMRADGGVEVVHAGDIRVGDVLQGANPITLEPMTHVVTYSETKLQPCVMLYTAGGKQMACSISAPIPTPAGLVLAPNMAGKQCAERSDDGEAAWADVARLAGLGQRYVQHISIADGCFWAGDVLHHNKLPALKAGRESGRVAD